METKNLASVCWSTRGRSSWESSWGTEELKALKKTGLEKKKGKSKEKQEFQESAFLSTWRSKQPAQGVAARTPAGDWDSAASWPV